MKLSERQEQLITDYLRAVARAAGEGVAEQARERGLLRLEERIRAEIVKLRRAQPDDADLEGVLRGIGSPAVQAALLPCAPCPGQTGGHMPGQQDFRTPPSSYSAFSTRRAHWSKRGSLATGPVGPGSVIIACHA